MTSKNQSGITSVMFALVFSAVLTMIAIGFAFVVRNDQRQTLDRYLSYQAQYAAESGVNQAINNIRTAQATLGTVPSGDTCQAYDFSGDGSVKATCVTWSTEADYIYKESLGSEPFITKLVPVGGQFSEIKITWQKDGAGSYGWDSTKLPNIDSTKVPILRMGIMAKNGAGYYGFKQIYILPTDDVYNFRLSSSAPNQKVTDGGISGAKCNGGICEITFTQANNDGYGTESVLSLSAIDVAADWVQIEVYMGGTQVVLKEAQITIDSNAIAQDVTKRVQARIPFMADTWNPGFVAAASEICKDIKIDGTNNDTAVSNPADSACPIL